MMIDMLIDGSRLPERRKAAAAGQAFTPEGKALLPYVKTTLTYAARMDQPFDVETIEGTMHGQAGDWLACGPEGELYPVAASVFVASYAPSPVEAADPAPDALVAAVKALGLQQTRPSDLLAIGKAREAEHLRGALDDVSASVMMAEECLVHGDVRKAHDWLVKARYRLAEGISR